jgi:2-oxoisovalerate dehydrogenase E1 component
MFGGIAGDISAYISEHLFEYLDAPVIRVASLDTPIPFNKSLENQYLPIDRLKEKVEYILKY